MRNAFHFRAGMAGFTAVIWGITAAAPASAPGAVDETAATGAAVIAVDQHWLEAEVDGDTAILSFYDPALGATNGVRSSDIFVRVDGRWHALYSQHSAVGKG